MSRDGILALVSDASVSHTAWRVTRVFQRLREVGVDAQVLALGPTGTDGVTWTPGLMGVPVPWGTGVIVLPRVTVPVKHRASFQTWVASRRTEGIAVVFEADDDCYSEAWAEHHQALQDDYYAVGDGRDGFNWVPQGMRPDVRGGCLQDAERDRWILSQVDGVTVSTEHLAGIVRHYTMAPVLVVPNAIDVDAFRAGLVERPIWSDALTIGWAGGMRPEADAEPVAEAWKCIAARYPDVLFVVAGWQPKCLAAAVPAERLISVPYRSMDEYPAGMQVTIGCCSAADTAFNLSRGPGKAWEFALAGAAVVASPTVYGNGCCIELDRLAETADDWERIITWLIDHPYDRQMLVRGAVGHVEHRHALARNLWRWQDAYRAIRASVGMPA
jgi:glycosyltransferase involved in cell wall biosynthesis